MLWWLEDGSDGLPPGIKYGYLELDMGVVAVDDLAYSFWWNPYPWPLPNNQNNSFDTVYHSTGHATQLGTGINGAPLHFTDYKLTTMLGASGSSIVKAGEHTIIGVTAIGQPPDFRRASD